MVDGPRGVEIGPDEKVWLIDNKDWPYDTG